jgi:biotin carboxyl carrier protein
LNEKVAPDPLAGLSPVEEQVRKEMEVLRAENKLQDKQALSDAVRRIVEKNTVRSEIPAPLGAKVVAIHKKPGEIVHAGDRIVTLELNGRLIPILAKSDGVMQDISVSKGGIIGNARPRQAKNFRGKDAGEQGMILLTLMKP